MVRKHEYRQEEDEEVEQSRVAARVAAAVAVAVAAGKEKSAKIENSIVLIPSIDSRNHRIQNT